MADRISREHLEGMLKRLARALNRPEEGTTKIVEGVPQNSQDWKTNPGYLFIERANGYYRVVEYSNDHYGEQYPLRSNGHTAKELYDIIWAILQVVNYGALKPYVGGCEVIPTGYTKVLPGA